ncbi:hypothetical protein ACFV5G_24935 [Streptomyces sp. NPDC059766]|uniref:hypothetical protein n=1 Tax=Streptomyces sp. NPDC059766 TaxID=3346940 RepID=UPI00365EA89A
MDVAQPMQDYGQAPGWFPLVFLAAGAFSLCLGLAFVRDYRGMSSHIAAAARDQDTQRLINKMVGWIFVICGAVFVYGATAITIELITS